MALTLTGTYVEETEFGSYLVEAKKCFQVDCPACDVAQRYHFFINSDHQPTTKDRLYWIELVEAAAYFKGMKRENMRSGFHTHLRIFICDHGNSSHKSLDFERRNIARDGNGQGAFRPMHSIEPRVPDP